MKNKFTYHVFCAISLSNIIVLTSQGENSDTAFKYVTAYGRTYFGHMMGRADSFEKTLMLGKIEGGEGDDRG